MKKTSDSTTKKKGSKKQAKSEKKLKVPFAYKPEKMTLEEWQTALRRQAAEREFFAIEPLGEDTDSEDACTSGETLSQGSFRVTNPQTKSTYKVVYRGGGSEWNYCSCMDFRTNGLGTCKHIEAVHLWCKNHRVRVPQERPEYSSVYISYRGGRSLRLRIGTGHEEELREISKPYFTEEGVLREESLRDIFKFLSEAARISSSFRWYSDAMQYICERLDRATREKMLADIDDTALNTVLKTELYPYQREGIRAAFRAGRVIIADEMGLGKTVQALGTAELLKDKGFVGGVLIVCPTSLKYQWKREIERFTGSSVLVIEGNHLKRAKMYGAPEFYKIVSYHAMSNDIKQLGKLETDMLIMDEVQRLKNWNTQISKAARKIESQYAVMLSGTPLENRIEELYSIMQFVDQYRLGPFYKFREESVVTSDNGKVVGYRNLHEVGEKLKPVMIRRRKADVAIQLPARMDKVVFVPMTPKQMGMHNEFKTSVAQLVQKWQRFHFLSETDRKRLLLFLSQMRMVCDSTFILDQESRYDTKVEEVVNMVRNVVESGDEKIVVFSQWERMTRLIAAELTKEGIGFENLHGGVPSVKRKELMDRFTDDPESRVFLSTDAGSTGLNLQVASIIINVDLPWNPAVLEQRIGRIYRIGQQRNIQVINLVASGTIEEQMLSTLKFKSSLFEGVLDNGEDSVFLETNRLDKIMETVETLTEDVEDVVAEEITDEANLDEPQEFETSVAEPESEEEEDYYDDYDYYSDYGGYYEDYGYEEEEESEEEEEALQDSDIKSVPQDSETPQEPVTENNNPEKPQAARDTKRAKSTSSSGGTDPSSASVSRWAKEPRNAQELVSQGVSFLSGLARTLQSPEDTKKLVDELVNEDAETGETTLNIPVPDKSTVLTLFTALGSLLTAAKK